MNTLFKKIAFLVGGAAALIGFGTQAGQLAPAEASTTKLESVTEKAPLVLAQASYEAGKQMGLQNHYSHQSHQSHHSHLSHYSSR